MLDIPIWFVSISLGLELHPRVTWPLLSDKGQMSDRTGVLQGANQISVGAKAPVAPLLEPPLRLLKLHQPHSSDSVKY